MTKWIKCSERMPEHGEYCWIYGKTYEDGEIYVFEGLFDLKSHDYRGSKLTIGPGWEYNSDRSDYVMVDQVTHWMTYYTPEPPHE